MRISPINYSTMNQHTASKVQTSPTFGRLAGGLDGMLSEAEKPFTKEDVGDLYTAIATSIRKHLSPKNEALLGEINAEVSKAYMKIIDDHK